MRVIADLHLHSKYSRATSPHCDLGGLAEWARIKGVGLLGTGDFTHPKWLKELRQGLRPSGEGLFEHQGIKFMLTAEVSNIFELEGQERTKKVHTVLFAPSFEAVEQVNDEIKSYGNLAEDGRPTLMMDIAELMDVVEGVSKEILFVPAHCLPPTEKILTNKGAYDISRIKEGDLVLTHRGRHKKVLKTLKRPFKGKIHHIIPYYFSEGTKTTPEHPFYAVQSSKNPCASRKICKPICTDKHECARRFYEDYAPGWVQAKDLEEGDILVFPRLKTVEDMEKFNPWEHLERRLKTSRLREPPEEIPVNKDFCRLIGYYLAEGYVNGRDAISFSFNSEEIEYIEEIKHIMESLFGLREPKEYKRGNGTELIYYSKYLMDLFSSLCYNSELRRANTKCLPDWMLLLPPEKQVQIFNGWWRGDTGYTTSQTLLNQMKQILLRIGVVPTISYESKEKHNSKSHLLEGRSIEAKNDLYCINRLSFFEDPHDLKEDILFSRFNSKISRRHGWMDEDHLYVPIRKIDLLEYEGEVFNLEVEGDNSYVSSSAAIHNCWTPWFGVFGSKSGFDSLADAFGKKASHIKAIETGLSSDPGMNWMLSALDGVSLISNSDAHSPQKLAREANVFELPEVTYKSVVDAIVTRKGFERTYEFYPDEGKYHWDGHRKCNVWMDPVESKKLGNRCPRCGKSLTVGVMHRVVDLADRKQGYTPEGSVPFTSLVPLTTVISAVRKRGELTKGVRDEYFKLVNYFGTEFGVLEAPEKELMLATDRGMAKAIVNAREGNLHWRPGYDGVFGELSFEMIEAPAYSVKGQKSLMDF